MIKNKILFVNTILVLSLAILACGGVTITINGSNTPSSASQITPPAEPAPSQISISTEIPTSSTGTNYDLYAGFTKNNPVSFVILHRSGEMLGSSQNIYSNYPSYVVWRSAGGEAMTVYGNRDTGLPTSAVIGNDILLYSNYTDTTVDLILVHQDGSREAFRVKRNTDILNKLSDIFSPSFAMGARPMPVSFDPQAEEILQFTKADLYLLSAAGCFEDAEGAAAGGTLLGGPIAGAAIALVTLTASCGGLILSTVIQAGKMANLNVANLETLNQKVDLAGCLLIDATDCLSAETDVLDNYLQHSNYIIANIPAPQVAPTPIQHTGTYP